MSILTKSRFTHAPDDCLVSRSTRVSDHPLIGVVSLVVGALALFVVARSLPDIVRYVRIKTM